MESSKRRSIKKEKNSPKQKAIPKKKDSEFTEDNLNFSVSDAEIEEEVEELEKEENEFLEEIKRFENGHKNSKIINVYKLIGKPKLKKLNETDSQLIKEQYEKLITMLDEKNIIVHFKNDYTFKEKFRFITEEIFLQDVEDVSNTNLHINFIYEDFHPEMDEEEEDEY